MATITTRADNGSPLTNTQVDANFTNLNDDKQEILAEGAFVDGDKTKLDGVATSATANPNAIDNVVEDNTPQLGGNLDLNSNDITGTGNIDVTGTVTADGLEVSGTGQQSITISGTSTNFVLNETDTTDLNTRLRLTGGGFYVQTINDAGTSAPARLAVNNATGDISFYEDTGATPKLFWDASAESLGIGTTGPLDSTLHVNAGSASGKTTALTLESAGTSADDGPAIDFIPNGSSTASASIVGARPDAAGLDGYLAFYTNDASSNAERMRIDSSGNVGIGGITPENSGGTWRNIEFGGGNLAFRSNGANDAMVGTGYVFKTDNSEVYKNTEAVSRLFFNNNSMSFQQAASGTAGTAITWTDSMTLDASGNLLVGTTSAPTGVTNALVPRFGRNGVGGIIGPGNISTEFRADQGSGTFTITLTGSAIAGFLDVVVQGDYFTSNREGYAAYKVLFNRPTDAVTTITVQSPTNASGASFTSSFSFTASKSDTSTLNLAITKPSGAHYYIALSGIIRNGGLSSISTSFA